MITSSVFTSIAHWIYAIQYLGVVLSFPSFLDPNQADCEKRQKNTRWIMCAANTYFYLQIAIWAGFMFAYTDYEDRNRFHKVYAFDAVNKLLPAILLIVSILVFRGMFNSKQAQKVFAKEKKIVLVHLVIFISFIILYVVFTFVYNNWHISEEGTM